MRDCTATSGVAREMYTPCCGTCSGKQATINPLIMFISVMSKCFVSPASHCNAAGIHCLGSVPSAYLGSHTAGHGQILSLPQPQVCAGAKPEVLICVQSNTCFQEACATSRYIDGRVWPEDDELEVRLMMDLIRHVTGDQSVHCLSAPLGIIWPCQQHQSLCCTSSSSTLLCESVFAYPWKAALSHIPQLPVSGLAACVQA